MSDLSAELSAALRDAGPKAQAVLERALADAEKIGGEVARRAAETSQLMARMLKDAAAGQISPDVAELAAGRYLDALGELALGAEEAAARAAIARVRDGIEAAWGVGLALARVGIAAAAAAL